MFGWFLDSPYICVSISLTEYILYRMAHHKSAIKRARQNKKRAIYNRGNRKAYREAIKAVRLAKTVQEAEALFVKATSILDRVASRGVLHKNNVANKKSKLALHINKMKAAQA